MKLPLLEKELRELATQQGLSLPACPPREGRASKPAAKLSPAARQAAQMALASYRESADYRDLMANLASLNLEQLQTRLASALEGPHFAPLTELLRDPAQLDLDLGDFIPKAISFGLLAQIVLFIGVSGGVGYIKNIDPGNSENAIYFGGAFDDGIDAGIEGDICLGFWTNAVDDMSGVYVGGEVDIDDTIGVTVATFLQDEEPALAFVGVDLGVDDGIENEDFYFFHIDTGSNPIYQPGDATYLVQLQTLTCVDSKDNYDTVKFTFQQDGDTSTTFHYPAWDGFQMAEAKNDSAVSTWNVGAILKFNEKIVLTLQVGDYTLPSVTIWPTDFPGTSQPNPNPYTFQAYTDGINEIKYTLQAQLLKN